jgi:hypothetical protein
MATDVRPLVSRRPNLCCSRGPFATAPRPGRNDETASARAATAFVRQSTHSRPDPGSGRGWGRQARRRATIPNAKDGGLTSSSPSMRGRRRPDGMGIDRVVTGAGSSSTTPAGTALHPKPDPRRARGLRWDGRLDGESTRSPGVARARVRSESIVTERVAIQRGPGPSSRDRPADDLGAPAAPRLSRAETATDVRSAEATPPRAAGRRRLRQTAPTRCRHDPVGDDVPPQPRASSHHCRRSLASLARDPRAPSPRPLRGVGAARVHGRCGRVARAAVRTGPSRRLAPGVYWARAEAFGRRFPARSSAAVRSGTAGGGSAYLAARVSP